MLISSIDPATMTHPSLKCAQSNDLEKNKPSKEGHTGKPPQGRHRASSKTIISFRHGDPEDPVNWSKVYLFNISDPPILLRLHAVEEIPRHYGRNNVRDQ